MSRARILADYVAGGTTAAEFDYLDGVTSNVQTQLTAKAPLASPTFTGTTTVSGDLVPSTPLSHRNYLINGDFQVAQRGTSFTSTDSANNDDKYVLDRWYLHTEGNDAFDVTQSSDAPTNQLYSILLDVETAAKKGGIAQIIENKNCVGLIGNAVTLSFKAKIVGLTSVKAGIIAWSGTADSVTSAFVSSWGGDGVTPTLSTNLTFENTPANLNVTTSWADYSVSATIDTSSTTNVIVYIWADEGDTTTAGTDKLYITDVQLEQGSNATPFEHRSYGDELARCQRYYQRQGGDANMALASGASISSSSIFAQGNLVCPMRGTIAMTFSDLWLYGSQNSNMASGSLDYQHPSSTCIGINAASATTPFDRVGEAQMILLNSDAGYMTFDAEL